MSRPVAIYRLWPCRRDPDLARTYWERNWELAANKIEESLRRSKYETVRVGGRDQIELAAYYWRRVRPVQVAGTETKGR